MMPHVVTPPAIAHADFEYFNVWSDEDRWMTPPSAEFVHPENTFFYV